MANMKYSRQRAAIKDYLEHTLEHPTADTVYMQVRKEFPNISLGTVYRNLNLLADMGEAIKISTPDGGDRFDGRVDPHYHVLCRSCGKVYDLSLEEQHTQSITEFANQQFEGTIDSHTTLFYGVCKECENQLNQSQEDESNKVDTDEDNFNN